ncbi:nucleotidyltransferase family protein [Algoriphagus hitonicola]|uniref:Nucleotidyl transferase n=1 Tax=Algoriphagus hitonicola TaxID=435880 RepID=A0A1I2X386_9BACT|nr:nucleotidyltransferase family protein [Algoriphagus hitonicola]SFH07995.1 Nucleotidyl transferase [Algoriphagus hitonicola]
MLINNKDFVPYTLSSHSKISDCLQAIDKNKKGSIFLMGENNKLLASLSDGDIRRAFLKGAKLEDNAITFSNQKPYYIEDLQIENFNISVFEENNFKLIPVCNPKKEIVSILSIEKGVAYPPIDNYVVLMVGGRGQRLSPLTQNTPKPLLKVGNKPILQTILERLKLFGFQNIILCTNYLSDHIEDFCGDGTRFGLNISYYKELMKQGTIGAVKFLEDSLKKPFLVMNGDLLTLLNYRDLLEFHLEHLAELTVGCANFKYQVPYGVLRTEGRKIVGLEEKPHYRFLINGGIYALNPDTLRLIPDKSYYDITDLIEKIINQSGNVAAYPIEDYWLDIGQPKDFEKANFDFERLFKNVNND